MSRERDEDNIRICRSGYCGDEFLAHHDTNVRPSRPLPSRRVRLTGYLVAGIIIIIIIIIIIMTTVYDYIFIIIKIKQTAKTTTKPTSTQFARDKH